MAYKSDWATETAEAFRELLEEGDDQAVIDRIARELRIAHSTGLGEVEVCLSVEHNGSSKVNHYRYSLPMAESNTIPSEGRGAFMKAFLHKCRRTYVHPGMLPEEPRPIVRIREPGREPKP